MLFDIFACKSAESQSEDFPASSVRTGAMCLISCVVRWRRKDDRSNTACASLISYR